MKKSLILFLITRIVAICFMPGIMSDTGYYVLLAQKMFHGAIPYIDFPFEYPPFAIFPIYLPGVISTDSYRLCFMLLALIFDFLIFWEVKKHGRDLFFYTILSVFMLPFALERLDIFMVYPIIMAVFAYRKNEFTKGMIWSTVGGWLKLVPFITYIGTWKDKKFSRTLVKIILLNAVILTIFSISFYSNMFDFLKYHLNRPFQVESVVGSSVFIFSRIFSFPYSIVNSFGGQNVIFNYDAIFLKASSLALFISLTTILIFFYKNKDQVDLFDLTNMLILTLMIFSKVLSDQYFLWPLALLFLGQAIKEFGTHDKAILVFVYAATGIIFVNYWTFIQGAFWLQVLLFLKNIGLIYLTFKMYRELTRQAKISRRPHETPV